jgi:hypothetical protein
MQYRPLPMDTLCLANAGLMKTNAMHNDATLQRTMHSDAMHTGSMRTNSMQRATRCAATLMPRTRIPCHIDL